MMVIEPVKSELLARLDRWLENRRVRRAQLAHDQAEINAAAWALAAQHRKRDLDNAIEGSVNA